MDKEIQAEITDRQKKIDMQKDRHTQQTQKIQKDRKDRQRNQME